MHDNRSSWGRFFRVGPRKGLALAAVLVLLALLLVTGVRPLVTAIVLVVTAAAMVAGFLVLEARRTAEEARREAAARRRRREASQRRAQRKLARQVRVAAAQSRQAARQSRRAATQSARAARLAGRAAEQTRTASPARSTGSPKKATTPVAPVDPWLNPAWLIQRLWSGFTSDALGGLQRLTVHRGATPFARGRAFLELARWHGADGHHERALEMVRLARVAHPPMATQPTPCAYEADFLCALGRRAEARELLEDQTFTAASEADRILRVANTYATGDDEPWQATTELTRLGFVNQVFLRSGFTPVSRRDPARPLGFDNLVGATAVETGAGPDAAKVTVLMPAYNAADVIERALASVLAQTWRNLEVLVVDDASVDSTVDVVEAVAARDPRVRLVRQPRNQGAYAARNVGLAEATGDLVTVHDADDWSHPQKIETLALRLAEQPRLVAALAHHVRALENLVFTVPTLRPNVRLVAANRSSLMIRREVFDEVGSWDAVRSSGDSELLARLEAFYGEDRVDWVLPEVPLSFSLVSPSSLTAAPRTGFPSMWQALGARRQYKLAYDSWHTSPTFTDDLPLLPDRTRGPLVAPALLRIDRDAYSDRFDVVMLSDFALPGGTTASNIQEIEAQVRAGLRVGLLNHRPLARDQLAPLNPALASLVDGDQVRLLSNGERIGCDLLTVRFPRAAEHLMDEMPVVKAGHVKVIVNQLPLRLYGVPGEQPTYDIETCQRSLERRFGSDVTWHPIGPVVRTMLLEHHAAEVAKVRLSAEDWVNVIDVDAWRRPARRPPDGTVRIGRHARDVSEKWPEDLEALRQSYPDRAGYAVHVLGGAAVPESLLGGRPASWTVHPFDAVPVRDFLRDLDVYVYQTHSRWVEAFGRSVLEALAVGLPVVTAPSFEPLFGPAAVYAEPHEVLDKVDALMSDDAAYDRQVRCANAVVEERFSFDAHLERLRRVGVGGQCEPPGRPA